MITRFVAQVAHLEPRFKVKTLSLALTLMSAAMAMPAFALVAVSESDLSEATAEGVAFLPTNFNMQFNGTDNTAGAGYVRLIPVGPLSLAALDTNGSGGANPTIADITNADHSVGKADIYLYGAALSKSDGDANTRFSNAKIASWGSVANPWLLRVSTEKNVPDFTTTVGGATPQNPPLSTTKGDVSYLTLEAPLYGYTYTGSTAPTQATAPVLAEADAYKLKLGLWADAFVRDPSFLEGNSDQFQLGQNYGGASDPTRANRLRLQMVWNGFSINGSNIKLFQTLGGVNAAEVAQGLSKEYNNTLGLAGVLRFNSGDSANLKAIVTDTTVPSTGSPSAWTTIHAGADTTLNASATGGCGNAGNGTAFSTAVGCQYIVQNRSRTDTKSRTRTWSLPSASKEKVLRLSTQEANGALDSNMLKTPAIDGNSVMPSFNSTEGVFIYNPNINLVLGSLYQPLMLGVNGKNITMEIARIPNKETIYKQIYTDYTGVDTSYKGSTCNVYQCGTSSFAGYQGSNATHSSISIGTAYSPDGGKTLLADSSEGAIGISFGALVDGSQTVSTSATTKEVQYAQRRQSDKTWTQRYSCSTFGGCNVDTLGHLYQWEYNNGSSFVIPSPTATPANATCNPNFFGNCGPATSGSTPIYGNLGNRTWSATALNGGAWLTASNSSVDSLIGAANGTTGYTFPAASQAAMPVVGSQVPLNNLGSAVIDGILIQHLKFTTTGL